MNNKYLHIPINIFIKIMSKRNSKQNIRRDEK